MNSRHRRVDYGIFVRLLEYHSSHEHHIHAIKAALHNKLGSEVGAVKSI